MQGGPKPVARVAQTLKFSPDIQAFINSFASDLADDAAAIFAGAVRRQRLRQLD